LKLGYFKASLETSRPTKDSREFHLLHSFWPQTILDIFHSLLFPISNMHFPTQLRKQQVVGLTCKQEAGDRTRFRIFNRDSWKSRRSRLRKTRSWFAFWEMDSPPQSRVCYLCLMSIASLMLRNEHHRDWLLLYLERVYSGHAHCGKSVTSDQTHSNFCFAFNLPHLVGEALLLGLLHL
jgi:hypothetical protein